MLSTFMLYKRTKNNRRVFFNFTYLMLWVGSSMIRTCRRSRRCRIPLWIRWVLCSRRSLIWWLRRWRWWTARLLLGWTWIGTWILTMCWRIRWLTSGSICLQNKKNIVFNLIHKEIKKKQNFKNSTFFYKNNLFNCFFDMFFFHFKNAYPYT